MPLITATELPSRGVLRLSGPDTKDFLQGLVSNDTRKLQPDQALYAALLSPQGKFQHELILAENGDSLLIDTEAARRTDLSRRLTLYRLRAKVEIVDLTEVFTVIAIWGEDAATVLGLENRSGRAKALPEGGAVLVDPRHAPLGLRLLLPKTVVQPFLAAYDLALDATAGDWDRHRLNLGIPDGSRDLIVDKALLLEANFEALNGVSFDKGCYVGQELTARTKHRATIRKRLTPVSFDGPVPLPETPVMIGEREVGVMRSAIAGFGLALLRIEDVENADLPLFKAGETVLHPRQPGWLRP